MAEVAGLLLSPFLQVLFERIASPEFVDFFRSRKLDGGLLKKLEIVLLSANAVLEDAEEMQFTKPMVKKWLDELKDAVYDAEDILDEIHTEVLLRKLEADQFQTIASKVRKTISTRLNPFVREIEPKIKDVLVILDDLVKQKDAIGLKEGVGGKSSGRSSTTSLVKESDIFGRNDDKEAVINLLLSDNVSGNELCVIAIVGMGGLGKTTLAQLVYNDDRMEALFDIKAWVCASDDFDVLKMTKAMLEKLRLSTNSDGKSLDWLQVTLQQNLTGKKFLLVLDDVWNKNYSEWEALSNPFKSCAKGSRVIVTTREKRVASIMRSTKIHELKKLQEEDCWKLFSKQAFHSGNSDAHPELEAIGRQIVKRCEGLPLAVKTIGALLWSELDVSEWNKILSSEIWDLPSDHVIPALRLSYKYLPLHLKRCFAYCSIFPQDYYFEKEELILLWMAEGLLPQVKDKTMEQIGDDYFADLVSRSLFQQSSKEYFKGKFGLHDLVNDLARFVSGQFTFRLEGENSLEIGNKTRHLSFRGLSVDTTKKFVALYEAKGLRTFLPIYPHNRILAKEHAQDLLPMVRCLRVLNLSGSTKLAELPDLIGKMKHLRYLDVSNTSIRKLPDSICKLCNLQTLRILWCQNLTVLPGDIHKLISLHHLDFRNTPIKEMPVRLGNLRHLQTLTKFVVGKQSRAGMEELGNLANLGGKLCISNLQNVGSAIDALAARLNDKKYLEELELEWACENDILESQRAVLDNLQPHANLKSLSIVGYGGKSFPDWIGYHSFGALKVLKFKDMPKLEKWFDFGAGNEGSAFTHLEELEIVNCPKLTGELPIHPSSLSRLVIVKCPLLVTSLPSAATLHQLELRDCNEFLFMEFPMGLQKLTIGGFDALESIPERLMDSNSSCLEELKISGCHSLTSLSNGGLPSTLKILEIRDCSKFELPMHLNYSSLERLRLENSCDSLPSFPLNLFRNLKSIELNGCRNLESINVPQQLELDLVALSSIEIRNCPNFVSFPTGGLRAPKLVGFSILNCQSLTSLPDKMHMLCPSLFALHLENCPEVESFPEGGLPSKLGVIDIIDCDKLFASRRGWGLQNLPSIHRIHIGGNYKDVDSFPEAGLLPTSLIDLGIGGFPNMKSLDYKALRHLTSLEFLSINSCPKLKFMQEEGLPTSIFNLQIKECALLEKQLQTRKGKAWRKISAHIPIIYINGELI